MDHTKPCPRCGQMLPPDAPDVLGGLCPQCLIRAGLDTGADIGPETRAPARAPFSAPSTADLAPFFPQLEILELLGRGGMGAVYKARQKDLDRIVAVKILPPGGGDDSAFAERFAREAKALARLNHPNIVTIHDFGQSDGLCWFIMEFVDGVNLRQLLEAGRLAPREALGIVPQVCDALQYAHDHGIIHRDIKPENILIDRRGRVKVADFGLAKIVQSQQPTDWPDQSDRTDGFAVSADFTEAGRVMGTPQYMAPEQTERPADVDHRADIYSLGVVFYQMLTGELPGQSLEPPSRKVHIDVRLDEVVLRALEQQPEQRYQQVSLLKTRVETILTTPPAADVAPPFPDGTGISPESPPHADASLWSPSQPQLVREILARMTGEERREARRRSWMFGVWNAATFFVPTYILLFSSVPGPLDWIYAGVALAVGLAFYPLWRRMTNEFLCTTAWARQQGITSDQLRGFGRSLSASPGGTGILPVSPAPTILDPKARSSRRLGRSALVLCLGGVLLPVALSIVGSPSGNVRLPWVILLCLTSLLELAAFVLGIFGWKSRSGKAAVIVSALLPLLALPGSFLLYRAAIVSAERGRAEFLREALRDQTPKISSIRPVGSSSFGPLTERELTETNNGRAPAATAVAPPVERVVNDLDEGRGSEGLCLKTGKRLDLPADGQRSRAAFEQWLQTNQPDLLADFARNRWALMCNGLALADFPSAKWDDARPADLASSLTGSTTLEKIERPGQLFFLLPAAPQWPLTLAFKTRDGTSGLLQITGANDDPRGLRIRYKLVPMPAAPNEPEHAR